MDDGQQAWTKFILQPDDRNTLGLAYITGVDYGQLPDPDAPPWVDIIPMSLDIKIGISRPWKSGVPRWVKYRTWYKKYIPLPARVWKQHECWVCAGGNGIRKVR